MAIGVPEKTEGSLGIEKQDNVPEGAYLDPRHWTTAEQFERLKSKVIELCEELNALEASGGLGGITQLNGDVTTASGIGAQAATVARLRGRDMTADAPTVGNPIVWNGTAYAAEPVPIRTVSTNTKILETDYVIELTGVTGPLAIEGPDQVLNAARSWVIKYTGPPPEFAITLTQAFGELIEGLDAPLVLLAADATWGGIGPSLTLVRKNNGDLIVL